MYTQGIIEKIIRNEIIPRQYLTELVRIFPLKKETSDGPSDTLDFYRYVEGFKFLKIIEKYGGGNIRCETLYEFPDGSGILLMYGDDGGILGIANFNLEVLNEITEHHREAY